MLSVTTISIRENFILENVIEIRKGEKEHIIVEWLESAGIATTLVLNLSLRESIRNVKLEIVQRMVR